MAAPSPARPALRSGLFLVGLLVVGLFVLALPSRADAATRYAAPGGTGASPCEQSDPCDIETAVETGSGGLADGDTVLLAPGTYHPGAPVKVFRSVTLSSEPGGAAPLIEGSGEYGLFMQGPSTVRDVRIEEPSGAQAGLFLFGGTAERVESTGEASVACALVEATLRDSVCKSVITGGGGDGISMFLASSLPVSEEDRLFNVTAIGGANGISVLANQAASVTLTAANTIASGGEHDVFADAFATTAAVRADLSHSNFADVLVEGDHAEVTSPATAGNQAAPPLFLDAPAGDYREAPASPTRGAGDAAVVLPGETDLAGQPRLSDCNGVAGVDIGAFQFQVECPAPPASSGSSGSISTTLVTAAPLAPVPHCVVPKLSGRKLKAAHKVARRGGCKIGAVSGRKHGPVKVVAQHPKPGRVLPAGTAVNVALG